MHASLFLGCTVCCGSIGLYVGTGRSLFSPYLPPHTAATAIQRVYRFYVDKVDKEWEWRLKLSSAGDDG